MLELQNYKELEGQLQSLQEHEFYQETPTFPAAWLSFLSHTGCLLGQLGLRLSIIFIKEAAE